jgi:hypothetical protein
MNPILVKRLETLEKQVSRIEALVASKNVDVQAQHEEKAKLLEEQWAQRKRLNTLNRIAEDYDELEREADTYRDERSAIRQTLEQILKRTRALRAEYRE